jgi:hypothetical protein
MRKFLAKVFVHKIVWDTDGEDVQLPSSVMVEIEYKAERQLFHQEAIDEFAQDVIEGASDRVGFLISDAKISLIANRELNDE